MSQESNTTSVRSREIVLINRTEKPPASRWNDVERLARLLSLVAIPVVLGVGGWWIQDALSQRSVNKDYVALAVSILSKSDQDADIGLRLWAVDLLNANSPVKFDPETSRKLSKGELKLPVSPLSAFQPVTNLPETDQRRTVARSIGKLTVVVNGREQTCTGWLVANNYIMTADYCTPSDAQTITLQLMAEQSVGKTIRVQLPPVEVNREFGYALLKTEGEPGKEFGYLTLASGTPKVNEPLFTAHYPQGGRFSFSDSCRVVALGPSASDMAHNCDTTGGVGGAPLIRLADLAVVGLHYSSSHSGSARTAKRIDAMLGKSLYLKSVNSGAPSATQSGGALPRR